MPDDRDACPDQAGRDSGCPSYRPAPPPDTERCYVTPATDTSVNVREQPTTQGRVLRTLSPNTHLLALSVSISPQGQTWLQVQLPDGLAFVSDSAVVRQGNCANLGIQAPEPVVQGGSMPSGLCFIDPFKVVGNIPAGVLDDFTIVPNPQQADPQSGAMLLNAALVTVAQPVKASFGATALPLNITWSSSVPKATLLRIIISTTSFQQVLFKEVPLDEVVTVNLEPGDYYWQFQLDTAGASLSMRCEPRIDIEETPAPYMPICVVSTETDSNGEFVNPRPIDKMPLVDGQDQPNSAGVFVLEYPFLVYEDILLRVLVSGSSPVKAMLFLPSVLRYESETTIAANGFADIPVPQGVYTLEFFSTSPFGFYVICWPGDTPPEVMGTPEPTSGVDGGIKPPDGEASTPHTSICTLFDAAPNDGLVNPHFIDVTPFAGKQEQPDSDGVFVLKYPLHVHEDTTLRVMTLSPKSSVKAMLYVPLMEFYQGETTIPAGGFADIPVPRGIYTLEFSSSTPFYVQALCWPGDTPPEALGTPEPVSEVGDAIGFIMGDCVAATGFQANGMPENAFTFDPMNPLKLEYLVSNAEGKFFQDIRYLIVNVPSNLFFNVSSNQGTLDLFVYDIAKGGAKASATYLSPGNYSIYLPESVYYVSFTSSVEGWAVVNCLPASEFPSGSSSPFDLPIPEQPISELLGVPLYGFEGYAPTPGSAEGEAALTPEDSSQPPLLLKRTGGRSVQIELPENSSFFFADPDSPSDDGPNGRPVLIRPSFMMGDGSVIPFDQLEDGSSTIPDPATSPVTGLRVDFSLPNGMGGFDDPIGGLVLEAQKGQKDCIPGDAKCIGQGGSGGGPQPFVFYLFNKGKSLTLSLSAAQAVLDALGTPTPSGSGASFFAPASGVFSPCLQTLTDSAGNFAGTMPFTEASFPLYYPTEDISIFAHTIIAGLSQVSTLTNTRISALVPDAEPNYLRLYAWGSAEKIGDQVREISIEIPPGFYFFIVANVQLDPIALQLGLDTIPTDTLILRCEAAN